MVGTIRVYSDAFGDSHLHSDQPWKHTNSTMVKWKMGKKTGAVAAAKKYQTKTLNAVLAKRRKIAKPLYYGSIKRRKFYLNGPSKELKWTDNYTPNSDKAFFTNVIYGGHLLLTNCKLGTKSYERIGKKITVKSIQVRLKLFMPYVKLDGPPKTWTFYPCSFRIMIWRFKEECTVNYVISDNAPKLLFQAVQGAERRVTHICSPLQLLNTHNFVVLKDVTQELDQGHGLEFFWQFYQKCNYPVYFNDSVNDIVATDIKSGAIFLSVFPGMADQLPDVYEQPAMAAHTRIRYYDD